VQQTGRAGGEDGVLTDFKLPAWHFPAMAKENRKKKKQNISGHN
jgi:hypothetical protein